MADHLAAAIADLDRQGLTSGVIAEKLGVVRRTVIRHRAIPVTGRSYRITQPAGSGEWRDEAVCRDEDPELFFPVGTAGPALRQVEQAQAVCRGCSVSAECLGWATATGQAAGVWGGVDLDRDRSARHP